MKRTFLGIAALTLLAFTAETANAQVVGGVYSSKVGNSGRVTVGFGNGWGWGGYVPAPRPIPPAWGYGYPHHGHYHWGIPAYPPATQFYYSTPGYNFYYSNRPTYRWGW